MMMDPDVMYPNLPLIMKGCIENYHVFVFSLNISHGGPGQKGRQSYLPGAID